MARKNIGDGISIKDLEEMDGEDLVDLLEEIIIRDNYGEADSDNLDSDTVLYQSVRIELHNRLTKLTHMTKSPNSSDILLKPEVFKFCKQCNGMGYSINGERRDICSHCGGRGTEGNILDAFKM